MEERYRSKYFGVYKNSNRHYGEKPWRVALKRSVNNKVVYENLGVFNSEETAAFVFNVYSLCINKAHAILNDVCTNAVDTDELDEYGEHVKDFYDKMQQSIKFITSNPDIKFRTNLDFINRE